MKKLIVALTLILSASTIAEKKDCSDYVGTEHVRSEFDHSHLDPMHMQKEVDLRLKAGALCVSIEEVTESTFTVNTYRDVGELRSLSITKYAKMVTNRNGMGKVSTKKIQIIKAGCDSSNYLNHNGLTDTEGSPTNVGRCYNKATELIINNPDINDYALIEIMCSKVIFKWPRVDWQKECKAAALAEAIK